jgi:fido (protein-threonine AMPylation protein)
MSCFDSPTTSAVNAAHRSPGNGRTQRAFFRQLARDWLVARWSIVTADENTADEASLLGDNYPLDPAARAVRSR